MCLLSTPFLQEYANGQNGTVYQCKSADNDREWKIATSVWHGVLLLLAVLAVPINCCAYVITYLDNVGLQ